MGARTYAAFYDNKTATTKIIATDEGDGYWFNTGITTESPAQGASVAAALNAMEGNNA